jgi:serine/threonine protein kinase
MAYSEDLDVPLAIKQVVNKDMGRIEAKIIYKLNKKNFEGFPHLYNMSVEGVEPSQINIVTDLIGSSLSGFLSKKQLTLSQILSIGIQLVERIRDLHSIGYIHGDVKPCNILIGAKKQRRIKVSKPGI